MTRVYNFFGGTSRFFALGFAVCGTVLAFEGKLTSVYVALVTALQALIVGHSIKEDYHERATKGASDADTTPANQ